MYSSEAVGFNPAVDAIGNSAAKMATLLLFAEQPDEALSSSQLGREFMEMQGEEPGWALTRGGRGTPFSYCERGIAPELLTETRVPSQRSGGTVKAYRINNNGLEVGVPLSGAVLEWELEYGNTSATKLLGYTSSARTDRMPSLRLSIYDQLIKAPGGLSKAQLEKALGETTGRLMQLIPNLRDAGVIDVLERYTPAHRTVRLSAPDFSNLSRGGPQVHPETHALFNTVNELVQGSQTSMTGQQLLDEITTRYPQYDPAKIWKRLTIARASGAMRFVDMEQFEANAGQQTSIAIAEDHLASVTALVSFIKRLETDVDYRSEMKTQAREIICDPEVMAELMAKANANSAYSDPLFRSQWRKLILTSIPPEGMDSRALYESIRPDARPISYVQFRRILAELDGDGFEITWGKARGRSRRSIGRVSLTTE